MMFKRIAGIVGSVENQKKSPTDHMSVGDYVNRREWGDCLFVKSHFVKTGLASNSSSLNSSEP